jgi:hypothetical protein
MSDGLNLLDIANLPAPQRNILRLVMRDITMTYEMLLQAVMTLPSEEQLSQSQLDEVLHELLERGWLTQESDGTAVVYRANLARKSGRTMSKNIWNALGVGDDESEAAPVRRGGNRGLPNDLWNGLTKEEPSAKPERKMPRVDLWDTKPAEDPPPRPRRNLWDSLDGDKKE